MKVIVRIQNKKHYIQKKEQFARYHITLKKPTRLTKKKKQKKNK